MCRQNLSFGIDRLRFYVHLEFNSNVKLWSINFSKVEKSDNMLIFHAGIARIPFVGAKCRGYAFNCKTQPRWLRENVYMTHSRTHYITTNHRSEKYHRTVIRSEKIFKCCIFWTAAGKYSNSIAASLASPLDCRRKFFNFSYSVLSIRHLLPVGEEKFTWQSGGVLKESLSLSLSRREGRRSSLPRRGAAWLLVGYNLQVFSISLSLSLSRTIANYNYNRTHFLRLSQIRTGNVQVCFSLRIFIHQSRYSYPIRFARISTASFSEGELTPYTGWVRVPPPAIVLLYKSLATKSMHCALFEFCYPLSSIQ